LGRHEGFSQGKEEIATSPLRGLLAMTLGGGPLRGGGDVPLIQIERATHASPLRGLLAMTLGGGAVTGEEVMCP